MDENRRLIFETKDDEDDGQNEATLPSKQVRFEGLESDSRSSKDLDTAPQSALLGMNASAQMSQGDIHIGGAGDDAMHVDEATRDDGVGVSMESQRRGRSANERNIEDQAGIILGIHNIFIVIPQFIITGLSSILFAIMDPEKSVLASHGAPGPAGSLPGSPIGNSTAAHEPRFSGNVLPPRAEGEAAVKGADSVGVIFRIGGVSAAVACVLSLRLARELKRARR